MPGVGIARIEIKGGIGCFSTATECWDTAANWWERACFHLVHYVGFQECEHQSLHASQHFIDPERTDWFLVGHCLPKDQSYSWEFDYCCWDIVAAIVVVHIVVRQPYLGVGGGRRHYRLGQQYLASATGDQEAFQNHFDSCSHCWD